MHCIYRYITAVCVLESHKHELLLESRIKMGTASLHKFIWSNLYIKAGLVSKVQVDKKRDMCVGGGGIIKEGHWNILPRYGGCSQ